MLQPKRRKFRKDFRGRRRGMATRGATLAFGEFGLKAMEVTWLTAAQIEAGRRAITNALKRKGRLWVRVFPDKPVTARGAGQRMGGGKGDVDRYVSVIKPGAMIFEIAGVTKEWAKDAFSKAADKLPIKTKFISKEE